MPRAGERRERLNMKRSLIVSLVIALAMLGALLVSLPTSAQSSAVADFTYDPLIATMIGQAQTTTVELYDLELSGRVATLIDGSLYTITTRNTNSGMPIQKATQYAYEKMQSAGLTVSYHAWTGCGTSNRNVVGVMTGTLRPSEIVLITAHIDDMPSSGTAPGADDNASGSVGVLVAAKIMGQYHFERTVRFVLFTGEEQGLCGSAQYANYISGKGDNVVAVYNMDMIAYDVLDGPTLRLHTRTTTNAGYPADLAIAGVFTNVVNTYGMSGALTPIVEPDGESASDHASFWSKGYPGILAIEDDSDDFNAYYHTINDNYDHVNLTYFTNYVKASIGTAAHLAYPIQHYAVLKGVVTDAGTALPIANARIHATASITLAGITSTNASGTYVLPLLDGVYTVTYSAYGYQPLTITGLTLPPDVTTTQDVSLTTGLFHVVSGAIRNATQGWPIAASISIAGYPTGTVVNDPVTGFYSVTLAENADYTFLVGSNGYTSVSRNVGLLTADQTENFDLNADLVACTAPGYTLFGVSQSFDATSTPPGWAVVNNVGSAGWRFDNPEPRSNNTGAMGNLAIADSDYAGSGVSMDTELRTPVMDLSSLSGVTLTFKTDFYRFSDEIADVDVSVNGAVGPWTNVWHKTGVSYRGPHTEVINLTSIAAGQSNVMVRFHYFNAVYEWWWEVDDVQLGQCVLANLPQPVVMPSAASQSAFPGSTVTYTLHVSNTDSITHAFGATFAGNGWPTMLVSPIGSIAPQASAPLMVTVMIPPAASSGASDVVTMTIRAQDNSMLSASAVLTTTAIVPHSIYLPLVTKDLTSFR